MMNSQDLRRFVSPRACDGRQRHGRNMDVKQAISVLFCVALAGALRSTSAAAAPAAAGSPRRELTVSGTGFRLDGEPFPYTGVSFFNAIYNPEFNRSPDVKREWIRKFKRYGINVLRIWGQWDSTRGLVDAGEGKTLYNPDGSLRPEHLATLKAILSDAA